MELNYKSLNDKEARRLATSDCRQASEKGFATTFIYRQLAKPFVGKTKGQQAEDACINSNMSIKKSVVRRDDIQLLRDTKFIQFTAKLLTPDIKTKLAMDNHPGFRDMISLQEYNLTAVVDLYYIPISSNNANLGKKYESIQSISVVKTAKPNFERRPGDNILHYDKYDYVWTLTATNGNSYKIDSDDKMQALHMLKTPGETLNDNDRTILTPLQDPTESAGGRRKSKKTKKHKKTHKRSSRRIRIRRTNRRKT